MTNHIISPDWLSKPLTHCSLSLSDCSLKNSLKPKIPFLEDTWTKMNTKMDDMGPRRLETRRDPSRNDQEVKTKVSILKPAASYSVKPNPHGPFFAHPGPSRNHWAALLFHGSPNDSNSAPKRDICPSLWISGPVKRSPLTRCEWNVRKKARICPVLF